MLTHLIILIYMSGGGTKKRIIPKIYKYLFYSALFLTNERKLKLKSPHNFTIRGKKKNTFLVEKLSTYNIQPFRKKSFYKG